MRKALLIVCAVVCSVFYVAAQQLEDVVYLKNGSVIRGTILEQVPGKTLKIMTNDGSQFVYQIAEVEKMTKEPARYQQQYQQPVYQQQYQQPVYQQPQQQPVYQQPQQPVYQQPQQPQPQPQQPVLAKAPKAKKPIDWSIRYKGEVNLGYAITGKKSKLTYEDGGSDKFETVFSRPLVETVHGVEIGPYFFVGAGVGIQYYCGKLKDFAEYSPKGNRWNTIMLPIFANIKVMYPIKDKVTPFINLGIGYSVSCYSAFNSGSQKVNGGLYCDFGVGVRYKRFSFAVGLQHQKVGINLGSGGNYGGGWYGMSSRGNGWYDSISSKASTKINAFYIKVGITF